MRKLATILISSGIIALVPSAVAQAQRHHHHHALRHHAIHRAHRAQLASEYWPIFEEWLTPQEGQEVEADVAQVCSEVCDPES